MKALEHLAAEHFQVTRRYFLKLGGIGVAGWGATRISTRAGRADGVLADLVAKLEYLTRDENFVNYGRGKPPPHELPEAERRRVGLARDTWRLEVIPDPESNARVERPLTTDAGTALDWEGLMRIARERVVRFLSVMSCTNGGKPCGMGLWEGVPLREVIWMARPAANIRRIFYYGYHNDDPRQRFQSSLPIGRVLEDPPGELPVILCYKLNGRWLTSKRGGPVRMLAPDAYGNKSVKWLQRILLTNSFRANDTYAEWNNDTVSHLKTCARFIHVPQEVTAGQPIPVTGVAQVGMSGLTKVQCCVQRAEAPLPRDDPYFAKSPWKDAEILPPPSDWGGGLPPGQLPPMPRQMDPQTGRPYRWPMRNTIAHWAALLPELGEGDYVVRCRTIDHNGIAQPMPRPFPKSGHNAIQQMNLRVASR